MSNSPSASKLLQLALLTPKSKQGPAPTTAPSSTEQDVTKTTILQNNSAAKPHHFPVLNKDQTRADVMKAKVVYLQQGKANKPVKFMLPNIRKEPSKSSPQPTTPLTPPAVKPIVVYPKSNVFIKPNVPSPAASESSTGPQPTTNLTPTVKPTVVYSKLNVFIQRNVPSPAVSESFTPTAHIDANLDPKLFIQDDTKWKFVDLNIKFNKSTETRNFSAKYIHVDDGHFETRTADRLIEIIGTNCFDVVISTIWSHQNKELKKQAVLALLTRKRDRKEMGTMTSPLQSELMDQFKQCRKPRTRTRRRPQPYVCQQERNVKIRKTIINPFENSAKINELMQHFDIDERESVPELTAVHSNESPVDNLSGSDKLSFVGWPSNMTITDSVINNFETKAHEAVELFTENPKSLSNDATPMQDLNTRQKRDDISFSLRDYRQSKKITSNPEINSQKIQAFDTSLDSGKSVNIPNSNSMFTETVNETSVLNSNNVNMTRDMRIWEDLPSNRRDLIGGVKPEDWFHLATPDRLKSLPPEVRNAWLKLQMYIDFKYCMEADEDNNLPIHIAVLNNDLDLLKRQCYMLKARNQSIDMGDANFNYSALQMCVVHEADVELARVLLRLGASPLEPDDEERTAVHLAAEAASPEYLEVILQHMAANPRKVLEAAELWTPEMVDMKPKDLISYLFTFVVKKCDVAGHTPLTLAARMGHHEHVMLLLEQIVDTGDAVNFKSPLTGSTALYETVEAACHLADKIGNKSAVPDKFSTTIQQLIRYGADPWIENGFGTNVNTLITECRMTCLNLLINDLVCQLKFRQTDVDIETDDPVNKPTQKIAYDGSKPFIIVKNDTGGYNYEDPSIKRTGTRTKKDTLASVNNEIVQNYVNINKKAAESSLQDVNAVKNVQTVKSGSDCPLKISSPHNVQSDQIKRSVENRQAVQNINNIPVNITSSQSINVVQNMPSVQNITSNQNMPLVQNIPSVRNMQTVQNIPLNQNMPLVQNIPSVRSMHSVQNNPSNPNMPLVQNIPSVRNMQTVQNVPLNQNMPLVQNIPSVRNMQTVQNVPLNQNMPLVQNIPSVRNMLSSQNIQALNQVPNVPVVAKLQQEVKHSAGGNSVKPIILKNLTLTNSEDFKKNFKIKPMKIKVMSAAPKRSHSKDSQEGIVSNEPAKKFANVDTPKMVNDKPQNIVITPWKASSSNQEVEKHKLESLKVAAPNAQSSFNDVFLASVKEYQKNVHDCNKNDSNVNVDEGEKFENNPIVAKETGQKKIHLLGNIKTERIEDSNTYNNSENLFRGFKSNEINMSAKKRCLELMNIEKNLGSGKKKPKL